MAEAQMETCIHCKKAKPDAHERQNPFQWEINDIDCQEVICDACCQELRDDI